MSIAWNRAPLSATAYCALPAGDIQPTGWLRQQLQAAAAGLTGRLPEVWADVGGDSAWLGGDGENWERGPYYARGLVALSQALADRSLQDKAKPWLEWALASQRSDGFFGPSANDDWWPRMPMLDALRWHYEASGDLRIVRHMLRYCRHLAANLPRRPLHFWAKPRGGELLDQVLWLYNHIGESWLLDLARLVHSQTSDWLGELASQRAPDETFDYGHGVNRAMGLKQPVLYSQLSDDPRQRALLQNAWRQLMTFHGQPNGMFSGDEFLHGRGSTQGTELCTVVETLTSLQTALRITGKLWIADAIERIAYNALPAMLAPDLRSRQYFQMPNQIECTPGNRAFHVPHGNDLLFGLESGFGCCTANLHIGWPRFTQHLWMRSRDGAIAALLLAPSRVSFDCDGVTVEIEEDTQYPFSETVRFVIHSPAEVAFRFAVRIPNWADDFAFYLNDQRCETCALPGTTFDLHRTWRNGDTLTLTLPMSIAVKPWDDACVVERGALLYALRIGEEWRRVGGSDLFPDFELHPTGTWNYALRIHTPARAADFATVESPMHTQPWSQDGAGIALRVAAQRLPQWSVANGVSAPPPAAPKTQEPIEQVTLIPYGCARLRISLFPVVSAGE